MYNQILTDPCNESAEVLCVGQLPKATSRVSEAVSFLPVTPASQLSRGVKYRLRTGAKGSGN
jgi:hypothetical protein